ncbi:MAG: class I SAM-dependent methyltransferase [Chitinophagaceae bacterium]
MNSFEQQYYEAETFWEGEMLQDPANRDRILNTAALIPLDTKTLADIGCGNGIFVNYLLDNNKALQITGVDRSKTALKYVRSNKIAADIASLPFANNYFDCVTCLEVIEHLPNPVYKKSLKELARIASKHIIISVPYDEKLEHSYTQCPACKTIFNKEIHLRSFKEDDILNLFHDYGFKCVTTQKLNPSSTFKGHGLYRKIFFPEQFITWSSPICPICGYEEKTNGLINTSVEKPKKVPLRKKWISYFTGLPKLIWPKETHYYWILAKYERAD